MIKVYVSGPYTTGDTCVNVRRAIDMGNKLLELGYAPFVPHLTHFWNLIHRHGWKKWMKYDLSMVEVCDCILRLPGVSRGGDIEVLHADKRGKLVFYSVADLLKDMPPAQGLMIDPSIIEALETGPYLESDAEINSALTPNLAR